MAASFLLGWEEWLALPDLGLPAIKAKIDTGARTSALHAFVIEPFGPPDRQKVRFGVRPIPGRDDVAVMCTADVVDRREVTSSNGDSELRYVIRSTIAMGGRSWPVEITLANRENMAYRMLLGRQAIQEDMFVDATSSFRQPRLSYKVYGGAARARGAERGLAISVMTRQPDSPSVRRLARAAERRGHTLTMIDRTRLSLYIDVREPAVFLDGKPLSKVDALIVRAGRTLNAFSLAAIRQLEMIGAYAINPADALARLGDGLAVRQCLAKAGITVPEAAVSHADLIYRSRSDEHVLADNRAMLGAGPVLRVATVGGRALAIIQRDAASGLDEPAPWLAADPAMKGLDAVRKASEAAARALGLGLAAVDIVASRQGPVVVDVAANVAFGEFDRLCGSELADAVIVHIEQARR